MIAANRARRVESLGFWVPNYSTKIVISNQGLRYVITIFCYYKVIKAAHFAKLISVRQVN
jgi:hypothetical protein